MKNSSVVILWVERAGLLCLVVAIGYAGWVCFNRRDLTEVPKSAPVLIPEVGHFSADTVTGDVAVAPESGRDLFSLVVAKVPADSFSTAGRSQLPSRFKVVGLILDARAQVILEDNQLKKTYFITQERGDGGFALTRVEAGRVELTYQGQTYIIPAGDRNGF